MIADATCGPATTPPAVLSEVLAARYPNGYEAANIVVALGAGGKIAKIASDADAPMRATVSAWAHEVTFAPASACTGGSSVTIGDVDFYPPSSGVTGTPHTVAHADFDNRAYTGGPGNCTTGSLHGNAAEAPDGSYDLSVSDVFSGIVAGHTLAVVILRCEYNGHGFDSQAQLFDVTAAAARKLGTIGSGGMMSSDSPFPPWPGGWIHVSFQDGRLYADVWNYNARCDSKRDWTSTAYTVRDGKLVALGSERHHRAGLQPACD